MNIKSRLITLEKKTGLRKGPVFLIELDDEQEEPTSKDIEGAKTEAIEKNPGKDMYVIDFCS